MSLYNNLSKVKVHKNDGFVSKKNLHLFSTFFICVLTFGIMGFSLSNLSVSKEVKNITSSWVPNIQDLGKLKFVINQRSANEDVFSSVASMEMPFENTYVAESSEGVFMVNGLGGLVVKSCLDGKVVKVDGTFKKTVHISHGRGLTSVYSDVDTVGVKEGDEVKKNSPIGVSNASVINFKILFRNKTLTGLTVKDGVLTFL